MRIPDILAKKRDGEEFLEEEIQYFVRSVTTKQASLEQIGAF